MAKEYKPGDLCQNSGIYKVLHDPNHTHEPHEVTVVAGHIFPPCNHCGQHPRFVLVRAAVHITNHDEFNPAKKTREVKTTAAGR